MPKPTKPLFSTAKITSELREAKDVQVSMPTVYRTLKAGISKKKARKNPLLTDTQI